MWTLTDRAVAVYIDYHARETFDVRIQEVTVTPEQAAAALAAGGGAELPAGALQVLPDGAVVLSLARLTGTGPLDASDTPCDPTAAGLGCEGCFNGGLIRVFAVPGQTSCDGLHAADALGL